MEYSRPVLKEKRTNSDEEADFLHVHMIFYHETDNSARTTWSEFSLSLRRRIQLATGDANVEANHFHDISFKEYRPARRERVIYVHVYVLFYPQNKCSPSLEASIWYPLVPLSSFNAFARRFFPLAEKGLEFGEGKLAKRSARQARKEMSRPNSTEDTTTTNTPTNNNLTMSNNMAASLSCGCVAGNDAPVPSDCCFFSVPNLFNVTVDKKFRPFVVNACFRLCPTHGYFLTMDID